MKTRPHLWLIALIGVIVPRRLRADWRQEWETELRYRELRLAEWDRLDWRNKIDLLRRSSSAFWDALWLQQKRLEADVIQDLRYGVRMLLSHPGFTVVAVLTLALGIGANTAMFGLLDKVWLRPLPVERPGELVAFVHDAAGVPEVFSYPKYTELRAHTDVLSGLVAYLQRPFSVAIDGAQSDRVVGQVVSGNYFDVLGIRPAVGRFFLPEEDQAPGTHPVAIVSDSFWRRRLGADSAAIGRTLRINGFPFTVIGVTPRAFTGTTRGVESDVYVPAMMQAQATDPQRLRSTLSNPNAGWLRLIGRLKPGVTRAQAQAALAARDESPAPAPGPRGPSRFAIAIFLADGSRGHTDRVQDLSLPLHLMMGVVGFVLLTACANVANMLLARASTRRKEMAVRLAIGASRGRIVRQLLTESTLLAALGGGAGLVVAWWVTGLLLGLDQQTNYVARSLDGGFDGRILAFTAAVSLLTAVLFSLAPSLQGARRDLVAGLKGDAPLSVSGWRRVSLRHMLVVAQVAMSLIVLIGAGLCVKSLRALQAIDPGFEPSRVVTASFDLATNGYSEVKGRQFVADVSTRVRSLPGVEAVGFASVVAFSDNFWISGAGVEGYQAQPGEQLAFDFNAVGAGYFNTIGARMLGGREFGEQDTPESPRVAMVNEAMARRYWPGLEALGKHLQRGPHLLEVVGVVANGKDKGLTKEPRPAIYLPLSQNHMPELTLHARSSTDSGPLMAAMRREIQTVDPLLPVHNLRTLAEQKNGSLYAEYAVATVLTLFALLALAVASVGLYGALSYAVTERTREMGIRMAHGAQPSDLLTLVVGQGMRLTLVGLVVGLGGALALTRLIQRLLFGVSTTDPLTFTLIPLALAAVALAACCIPAWRAMRMNPVAALRHE